MHSGIYRFADIDVEIVSLFETVHRMCADYATDSKPTIRIVTTAPDIAEEAVVSVKSNQRNGLPSTHFPDDYLETLAVYRKLATALLNNNVLLFHGSAVAVDGWAYLFTAKSGTGKSTHTALWRKMLGGRALMVNDDKPLIRITPEGKAVVYGTPWDGKHHLSKNSAFPLKAICWLTRAKENTVEEIAPAEICETLVSQTFRPQAPQSVVKMLDLVNRLSNAVRLYKMGCNTQLEAAELAYKTMNR